MSNLKYRFFYKRKLPHIQPKGSILFVTFRLSGSIPKKVLEGFRREYEKQKRNLSSVNNENELSDRMWKAKIAYFEKIDRYLDRESPGPFWLKDPDIAEIVVEGLHHRDANMYKLYCYCIMPNHVHVLFEPLQKNDDWYSLSGIMHSLKRYTASEGNKVLGKRGSFWTHESYDHYIRDYDDFERVVAYILDNPVNVGLVNEWDNWEWSYVRDGILG